MKQTDVFKWLLVAGAGFAMYKIFQKIGLIQTAQEKKEEAMITQAVTGWQWNPAKTVPKGYNYRIGIAGTNEDKIAQRIWDAIGGWLPDDEEKIYAEFRALVTQSQTQDIAEAFKRKFGQDLVTKLKAVLSDSEFLTLLQIIETKPKGLSINGVKYI